MLYILETLISPGIWASREKINIQAYEVDFKELPKGIYRVICLYKGEADVSDLNTQSIIVSPIVKIDFCLSATKVQANNHTTQLLFGKDVMFFPNPANSQIQIMVKRDLLSSNSKIVIQNAIGSIVKEESIQETLSIIDVQMLNNGIYFINLISNDLPIFKDKVIIQHH